MRDDANGEIPPIERLIELALFGPLVVGAAVVERAPAAVRRARQDLVAARFLGEMAVTQGARRLAAQGPEEREPRADSPSPERAEQTTGPEAPAEETIGSDRLALPDYDHLPAVDIVAKLGALSSEERDEIEMYERAHRRRRTVLGKIEQLRG